MRPILPHSNRVNYNDHYVSSAIRAYINKTHITTVQTEIFNQNKRGTIEKSNFNISISK